MSTANSLMVKTKNQEQRILRHFFFFEWISESYCSIRIYDSGQLDRIIYSFEQFKFCGTTANSNVTFVYHIFTYKRVEHMAQHLSSYTKYTSHISIYLT